MSVEFKELTDNKEVEEYVKIHKEIFNLSDNDAYPATFFSMLIRNEHPTGIVIGCYIDNILNGLAVAIPSLYSNSLYIPFAGIKKELQGGAIAYKLIREIRETAYKKGFNSIFGIIDPLKANLGKMYSNLGSYFIKCIPNPYQIETEKIQQVNKLLFECNSKYLNKVQENTITEKNINSLPIANKLGENYKQFLYEIPNNMDQLSTKNPKLAEFTRHQFNQILSHYITERNYIITKCFSCKVDGEKKTFYLFEN